MVNNCFEIVSALFRKGTAMANEDSFGCLTIKNKGEVRQVFVVTDGATGLTKQKLVPEAESDASWLAQAIAKETIEQFKTKTASNHQELLKKVFEKIAGSKEGKRFAVGESPNASIGIITIENNKLNVSLIGDVTVLLRTVAGETLLLYDSRVEKLGTKIIQKMQKEAKKSGKSIKELRQTETITKLLLEDRKQANRLGGYVVGELHQTRIEDGLYYEFKTNEIEAMAMMSDGYVFASQVLKLTPSKFLDLLIQGKAKIILEELICKLDEDTNWNKYPRFKQRDDATVLVVN